MHILQGAGTYQWPRLNVARSIFDSVAGGPAAAASAPAPAAAAGGAGGKEAAPASALLQAVADADEVGEAWGDDDLDLPGEGGAAAKAAAYAAAHPQTVAVGSFHADTVRGWAGGRAISGAAGEDEEGGWDIDDDALKVDPAFAAPSPSAAGGGAARGPGSSGAAGQYYVPPTEVGALTAPSPG
jgi:hypothetical protein